jgi:hypothetical protein
MTKMLIKFFLVIIFAFPLASCGFDKSEIAPVYNNPEQDVPRYYYKTELTLPRSSKLFKNPYQIYNQNHSDHDQNYVEPYSSHDNFEEDDEPKEEREAEHELIYE